MSFVVEDSGILVFLILTVILGGGAAFLAGRSLARGWKSQVMLFVYMLIFTAGIRFLHFALFQDALSSLEHYISTGIVIMLFAFLGYRMTLAKQMTEKYPWLYERTSPFSWRQKA